MRVFFSKSTAVTPDKSLLAYEPNALERWAVAVTLKGKGRRSSRCRPDQPNQVLWGYAECHISGKIFFEALNLA